METLHRALPLAVISLALIAGSVSVSAQQFVAERIYEDYLSQAQLPTPLAKNYTQTSQPVAKACKKAEIPVKPIQNEPKPYNRPSRQPES